MFLTSSFGFVFAFKNILEKKLSDGAMQINENAKECITHLELEKHEGKKYMFLFFYDGIVSVYSQEHEAKIIWKKKKLNIKKYKLGKMALSLF